MPAPKPKPTTPVPLTRPEKAVLVIALKEAIFAREVELENVRRGGDDLYDPSDISVWKRELELMQAVDKRLREEITRG